MTEQEINALIKNGYKFYRLSFKFGSRMIPYYCHAKTTEDTIATCREIMGRKYAGMKACHIDCEERKYFMGMFF